MNLPTLSTPLYDITLPISGKKLTYRPYLVREQKILLTALQSGDEKAMVKAISQMLKNCIQEDTEIDNLPLTDFEYLFLKLRAVSVGEFTELRFRCKHLNEKKEECGNLITIPLDLNDITVDTIAPKANIIELSKVPALGVKMKYPSYALMEKYEGNFDFAKTIELTKECIDNIFDDKNVYTLNQYTPEKLDEWIDNLTQEQYDKILNFFNDIPVLKKDLNLECRKCGLKEVLHLEGVASFFV